MSIKVHHRSSASTEVQYRASSERSIVYSQLTKLVSMTVGNSATSLWIPALGAYASDPDLRAEFLGGANYVPTPYRPVLPYKLVVVLSTALREWCVPYTC